MQSTDSAVRPTVVSAAAGRMRVHAAGFRHDVARAAAIEQTVARLTGVHAVQAYPRTASVVVWYATGDCDLAAVLSAISGVEAVPDPPPGAPASHTPVTRRGRDVPNRIIGAFVHTLLIPHREMVEGPPEIERLRTALERIGYHDTPAAARQPSAGKKVTRRTRSRSVWLALSLGLLALRLSGVGLSSLHRWAADVRPHAGLARRVPSRRRTSPLAVLATSTLAVPSWGGVVVSLLLVGVAGAIAYRQRLGLTRELVVAAARAAVQLVTAGALLRIMFQRTRLLGPAGWLVAMILIAGQVAGRRGGGLPRARAVATGGVATSTVATLTVLLAGRVIAAEARVIVPVGGMIVSSAMLAAGSVLRRLDDEIRQSRPAIEARLSLGQSGRQAILPHTQSALRTALLPAIDSTKVVGLISLPGAMTGLILAGVSPLTAIRYQIVVMYMQLAGTALAALTTVRLAEKSLLDDAQRLFQINQPDEPG